MTPKELEREIDLRVSATDVPFKIRVIDLVMQGWTVEQAIEQLNIRESLTKGE